MLSKDILKDVEIVYKSDNYHDDIEIEYLSDHTNDIKDKTCFICIKGNKFDSHDLISSFSIKPILIIASKQIETDIPYVIIPDTEKYLPLFATRLYDNPSHKLDLIGITGTDGKTTTAIIIKQLLEQVKPCAYIGTNGFMINNKHLHSPLTTPKPIMLNRFLNRVVEHNIPYTTLEVSSQGIDLHRIDHLKFKVAIFTNLTHEHLDYHKTIENYFLTKLKLFQTLDNTSFAVINLDSPYAEHIINNTKAQIITYGKNKNSDFCITNIETSLNETSFDLITKNEIFRNIKLNLFGDYNVYNTVSALATIYALGYDLNKFIPKLQSLDEIDGRMHFINLGQPYDVIVDFAHTPNALESLLSNIRSIITNRIILVFGAAGERDNTKRPLMGEVADKYSSVIILTSEDPKSEDVLDIITDIAKGIKNIFKVIIIPNRKKAILKALEIAQIDDLVVITGKGNEKFEIFNGYKLEHNDITIVEDYLTKKYQFQYTYSIANL